MRSSSLVALLGCALLFPALAQAADTRPTVAVLYFDYSGQNADLSVLRKGLAQMLISDLSAVDGIRLVERDRLEEILNELKLGQTAKIDPQSAAKVGKLLGARYMVLGGYFDLMQTLRADARVVEVESGKVVQSIGAAGKPDEFLTVEQKLCEGLTKILQTKATPLPQTPDAPAPTKKPPAPPKQLRTSTALRYSKALHAIDRGDKKAAREELAQVVKEQPDFKLASLDMDKLIQ
jgi:TolB-like protein